LKDCRLKSKGRRAEWPRLHTLFEVSERSAVTVLSCTRDRWKDRRKCLSHSFTYLFQGMNYRQGSRNRWSFSMTAHDLPFGSLDHPKVFFEMFSPRCGNRPE